MKNIDMIKQMEVWELRQKVLAELPDNTNLGEWLEQEAEKQIIFKPREGETYYSVNYSGRIKEIENRNLSADKKIINFGNACTDKSVMERKAHDMKLWSLLWNFAEENNGKIDWKDFDQYKYSIFKDHENGEFLIPGRGKCKHFEIYFSSKELAQRAIDEIVLPWERGEL